MVKQIYTGKPWHADEDDDTVRIFRGNLQIIKAPKQDTPYEEYWPDPDLLTWMLDTLNAKEAAESYTKNSIEPISQSDTTTNCWCYNCLGKVTDAATGWPMTALTFIVCPDCGNKRCPKSTDHNLACTNSNDLGQTGSRYE